MKAFADGVCGAVDAQVLERVVLGGESGACTRDALDADGEGLRGAGDDLKAAELRVLDAAED